MPIWRQDRDQIPDQEKIIELEHFLKDKEPDREIIARREIEFFDPAELRLVSRLTSFQIRHSALEVQCRNDPKLI